MGLPEMLAPPESGRRRVTVLPTTVLGWRAIGLAACGIVLVSTWAIVPRGAALGFALAVAGGVAAIVAIRRGERALTVFTAVLPLVCVAAFVVAELAVPH
jgi:hypothetical protein